MTVTYYQKFSENEVFADALLNTTFNQIYTYLINVLGHDLVTENLLIDGKVALIMQSATLTTSIQKVEMVTANKEIFNLLKSSYSSLPVTQIIIENKSITMVINSKIIVLHFSSSAIEKVNVEGIYVKSSKFIPWQ
jgi:hypothetical protein